MKTVQFRAFSLKKRRFFTLKTTVPPSRNGDISVKKRRFLKVIFILISIKMLYRADYQHLLCNVKNKRFLTPKDNATANNGCTYGQNSYFVNFIHWHKEVYEKAKETWSIDVFNANTTR
ncbi:MAG: hypothetical protein ACTTIF_02775 [Prevotella sp.]